MAVKAFKLPKEVLTTGTVKKKRRHATPKPEDTSLRVPRFSIQGLYIDGIPVGSTLEWNVAVALDELDLDYNYQVSVFGGRWNPGGAVVDFEVFTVPTSTYLFAQGDYWHTRGNAEEEDQWLIARIQAELKKEVVEVWEHEALTAEMAKATLRKKLRV